MVTILIVCPENSHFIMSLVANLGLPSYAGRKKLPFFVLKVTSEKGIWSKILVNGRCPRFRQTTPSSIFILTSSYHPIKNNHGSRSLLHHLHHKFKLGNQRRREIVLTSVHAQPIQ